MNQRIGWMMAGVLAVCGGWVSGGEPKTEPTKPRQQLIDYGPFVSYTLDSQWPRMNITYKGIAVRLTADGKDRGGLMFDTDLLRFSSGWTGGFLRFDKDVANARDYRSIIPEGTQVVGTSPRPGAARAGESVPPATRPSMFGPLPKDWGRYEGLYLHGDSTVISYRIGLIGVLELPGIEGSGKAEAVSRTIEAAPSKKSLALLAGEREGTHAELKGDRLAVMRRVEMEDDVPIDKITVTMDRVDDNWERLSMGAPSQKDYATIKGTTVSLVHGGLVPLGKLPLLTDGFGSKSGFDEDNTVRFEGPGRLLMDLRSKINIRQIDTFSWQARDGAPQVYQLYGSDKEERPVANGADPAVDGWKLIEKVDSRPKGIGAMHGVSIRNPGGIVGAYRHLLFVIEKTGESPTFYSEFDVYTTEDAPKFPDLGLPKDHVAAVGLVGKGGALRVDGTSVLLEIPPGAAPRSAKLLFWSGPEADLPAFEKLLAASPAPTDLAPLTKGGPRRWNQTLETVGKIAPESNKAYVLDTITMPDNNPWNAWFRPGGFDFFSDGTSAAISNWNGDLWLVKGIDAELKKITWQRIATGFYHPLGVRIVDDQIYVLGRDQITRLKDLNGDGEIDFYENFNNDAEVTWNFHEFAFDLQSDAAGNFYYSKGGPVRNGGRGFERIGEHHGCVLKVSKDGSKIERFATGFRAPNGIGVGPDGQVTTGDNEGTWMPMCRLNWVKPGGFYGVVDLAHRAEKPTMYDPPICWFPREADNSGGGQAWVTSKKWGPFEGQLLHLSYGTSSLWKVMHEHPNGTPQGGVVKFPLTFDSGIMRARFNAKDGQLYVSGLKGWQTNASRDGAFQRVRYTGKPANMPTELNATPAGIRITFTDKVDAAEAANPDNYSIEQWNYLWSEQYGSAEYSVADPKQKKRDNVTISKITVADDGKSVLLEVPGLKPVMQMKITFKLKAADGAAMNYDIYNTINVLK